MRRNKYNINEEVYAVIFDTVNTIGDNYASMMCVIKGKVIKISITNKDITYLIESKRLIKHAYEENVFIDKEKFLLFIEEQLNKT